jgi:RimJ/RimL family protein N-acetyltransferase
MSDSNITTKRLGLRLWKKSDTIPFAEMCADIDVMRYFPSTLTKQEATLLIKRFMKRFEEDGYTYYAVDILATKNKPAAFIGFTGLLLQTYESPFTPNVDIGWRLKKAAWAKVTLRKLQKPV